MFFTLYRMSLQAKTSVVSTFVEEWYRTNIPDISLDRGSHSTSYSYIPTNSYSNFDL